MLSIKDTEKRRKLLVEKGTKCKCGHRIPIPSYLDRAICSWCQHYVYRTPQLEFQYRLKEKLAKINKK